jgi:regulatory protein
MDLAVAMTKLRTICSKQEKSPADIILILKKLGVEKELHDQILDKLKSEKFVDEQRYASAYTRDKIKFDHWGFVRIRFMLQQKGIDKKIIDKVIEAFDTNEYHSIISLELSKKRKTLKGTRYEIWAKLARYGISKGYEMHDMEVFLEAPGE